MNDAMVSMSGYVATQPRWRGRDTQTPNVSMRVAWTPRRLDRMTGEWTDGHTSYASVYCWRKLAENAATCLRKGDPVLLQGRLSIRDYVGKDGAPRIEVEISATSLGHDLNRGMSQFARVRPVAGQTADEFAAGGGELAAVPSEGGLADGAADAFGDFAVTGPLAGGSPRRTRNDEEPSGGDREPSGDDEGEAEMFGAEAAGEVAAAAGSILAPF